ncbi:flagellar hook-basal body complex protein FliE [Pisciglobus halotolerans]|uniref:Flagellar hook-basal body complex protein FliE n=1 Tax=Pisciglobus halotolerans TaxID=745365 RepID=A0A1I3AND0_9LACT|nr:flagellar hook-basal body complex protein FliE [Pisciglobus halotolerans]SFH51513.1 flagellar hook-basal body complex protein FliE [Pisciglobus halotolerans]
MNIDALYSSLMNGTGSLDSLSSITKGAAQTDETHQANGTAFSNLFEHSLQSLNDAQVSADQAVQGLVSGKTDNMHDVMIQSTEAQLQLELAIQVRNKLMDGYNDIKNMQY